MFHKGAHTVVSGVTIAFSYQNPTIQVFMSILPRLAVNVLAVAVPVVVSCRRQRCANGIATM
jgi:hypothetical protein